MASGLVLLNIKVYRQFYTHIKFITLTHIQCGKHSKSQCFRFFFLLFFCLCAPPLVSFHHTLTHTHDINKLFVSVSEAYEVTDFLGLGLRMQSRAWRQRGREVAEGSRALLLLPFCLLCISHAHGAATAHTRMTVSSHWATSVVML